MNALYRTYDKWLFLYVFLLIGIGSLMIYSSTSVITPVFEQKKITSPFFYFKRHLFTVMIGMLAMSLAYRVRPDMLKKYSVHLLIFSFLLLCLVFLPGIGVTAGNARRWLRLWPSTFQPSELVKLAMVIFLARYISSESYRTDSFKCFAVPIVIMTVFQIIFLKQPDFGSAMSLGALTLSMLFLSGLRLRYLALLLLLAIPVVAVLIREPYRWLRIISFLDPWKYPQGSGFQLIQSLIAFGSGGLTGVGLGNSKQKLAFLPESHTDFIFPILGEELGFPGVTLIVVLFMLIFARGMSIAKKSKNSFVYYLSIGLSMMIALQAIINFFVVSGMAPTKGLPLPFISYGGSAFFVNMIAIGILLNFSKGEEAKKVVDRTRDIIVRKKAVRSVYGIRNRPAGARVRSAGGEFYRPSDGRTSGPV